MLLVFTNAFTTESVFVSGTLTYGNYSGSAERDRIINKRFFFTYAPDIDTSFTFNLSSTNLDKKSGYQDINQLELGLSGQSFFQGTLGLVGGRLDINYLNSDDPNSDNTFVPFFSLMYKSTDRTLYFDIGYAYSNYEDTTAHQMTATGGFSLFNWMAWLQTRLYYTKLTERVQTLKNAFAIEESLTYYAIPRKLTLHLNGMVGKRIYTYSPDLMLVYNLPDVLKASVSGTVMYNLVPNLTLIGDISYEKYTNYDIKDDYDVIYLTAGLKFRF